MKSSPSEANVEHARSWRFEAVKERDDALNSLFAMRVEELEPLNAARRAIFERYRAAEHEPCAVMHAGTVDVSACCEVAL